MKIDLDHLSKLARIEIAPEKRDRFTQEMEEIIEMVANLPSISDDLTALDPLHPMELRSDIIKPSSPREDILLNAPDTQAGCIVVPKIME
ncbi:MAG: Asp-tRNA(Asn)/Glu-tRNA(Gln) amidotransferase subunit GatC [Oscillospiraceae bacterium]